MVPKALERAADEAGEDEMLRRPRRRELELGLAVGRDPARAILCDRVAELLYRRDHAVSSHGVEEI